MKGWLRKAYQQDPAWVDQWRRKDRGFKTPNQVFFGINPPVALAG